MANPTTKHERKLHRLGRYLIGKRRHQIKFAYQTLVGNNEIALNAWSDTDFAGCKGTRKSTSEGVVQLGSHTVTGGPPFFKE